MRYYADNVCSLSRFGSLSHTYDYSIFTYVYNFANFFRSPPMQGYKGCTLTDTLYFSILVALAHGYNLPIYSQAVQYIKEYFFCRARSARFYFRYLYVCMVANIVYISRGLCMVAKSV